MLITTQALIILHLLYLVSLTNQSILYYHVERFKVVEGGDWWVVMGVGQEWSVHSFHQKKTCPYQPAVATWPLRLMLGKCKNKYRYDCQLEYFSLSFSKTYAPPFDGPPQSCVARSHMPHLPISRHIFNNMLCMTLNQL